MPEAQNFLIPPRISILRAITKHRYDILIYWVKYLSSRPSFLTVNSCTTSRPVQKNDNRLVFRKLPFKLSIVMPILVPVDFVYKHCSPCSTCMIKRTLRFWFGSNCIPGISFAYLYAYSKKSFGHFNYLIGYLRKYAAYLELWIISNGIKIIERTRFLYRKFQRGIIPQKM